MVEMPPFFDSHSSAIRVTFETFKESLLVPPLALPLGEEEGRKGGKNAYYCLKM